MRDVKINIPGAAKSRLSRALLAPLRHPRPSRPFDRLQTTHPTSLQNIQFERQVKMKWILQQDERMRFRFQILFQWSDCSPRHSLGPLRTPFAHPQFTYLPTFSPKHFFFLYCFRPNPTATLFYCLFDCNAQRQMSRVKVHFRSAEAELYIGSPGSNTVLHLGCQFYRIVCYFFRILCCDDTNAFIQTISVVSAEFMRLRLHPLIEWFGNNKV